MLRNRFDAFRSLVLANPHLAGAVNVIMLGFLSGAFSAAYLADDEKLLWELKEICTQYADGLEEICAQYADELNMSFH